MRLEKVCIKNVVLIEQLRICLNRPFLTSHGTHIEISSHVTSRQRRINDTYM